LKVDATVYSETLVPIYQTVLRHVQVDKKCYVLSLSPTCLEMPPIVLSPRRQSWGNPTL